MTNAEKYLKVSTAEFIEAIIDELIDIGGLHSLENWLVKEVKPTLTEDERVILRNIDKKYSIIYRDSLGRLEIKSVEIERTIWKISMVGFNHLFQFIKERRRIFNRGVAR